MPSPSSWHAGVSETTPRVRLLEPLLARPVNAARGTALGLSARCASLEPHPHAACPQVTSNIHEIDEIYDLSHSATLGRGACGFVSTVTKKATGEMFAMKTVRRSFTPVWAV